MAKPNFTILGKIHRNEISISNKHKDTLDKLISLGYINNIDGEWEYRDWETDRKSVV